MHYVISDIHNEAKEFNSVLELIKITQNDVVIILGDLFDRGGAEPDPVGVYFTLSGLQDYCIWIRGNHDQWLANYMMGNYDMDAFFLEGIDGYILLCGHTPAYNLLWKNKGEYLDEYMKTIWRNGKENVYLLDCGCGFSGGRLACMCPETGDRFYSKNV